MRVIFTFLYCKYQPQDGRSLPSHTCGFVSCNFHVQVSPVLQSSCLKNAFLCQKHVSNKVPKTGRSLSGLSRFFSTRVLITLADGVIKKGKRALSEEALVLMNDFFMNRPLLAKLLVVCLLFLKAQDLPGGWMSCSVQRRPTHCGG